MKHSSEARRVLETEIRALKAVKKGISAEFDEAVELILATLGGRGKVVVAGMGKSGNICQKISATFASTGTPSVRIHPADALHGDLGVVSEGDCAVMISYSGETDELVNMLPAMKRLGVKIIAITGQTRSTLAKHSDVVLNARVPAEACPFNLAPTSSTTAALALGDALAMTVLKARGFSREDFARLHPSGSIGRSLLLRVEDVMRTGPAFPRCDHREKVQTALKRMTQGKAGSIAVTDARGKLAGIFTHGDFVRHYQKNPMVGERRIREVMTRNPITVKAGSLAMEAVRIFQEKRIDDLLVVGARREPVGLIDSQDLAKLKVL
jgi:arabinose-5-phosphate isomerase